MLTSLTYGSVCSGAEAATLAWHSLGWKPVWFSEIEKFPCKLLKHHYPHVPNLGNMLNLTSNPYFNEQTIDVLVGGTPCQDFSVAGLRAGLSGERGNLTLEFCRILQRKRDQGKPIKWFVWENVPGALSSYSRAADSEDLEGEGQENGKVIEEKADFAEILSAFSECGYSVAWRVLDAQFIGVPQRRRRLFVIGHFGSDWRPSAAVLFDGESLSGNTKKGRIKRESVAGTLDARTNGGGFPGSDGAMNGHVIAVRTANTSSNGCGINEDGTAYTLDRAQGQAVVFPCWWDGGQTAQTLDRVLSKGQTMPEKNRFPAVLCYPYNQIGNEHCRSNPQPGDPSPTLSKSNTFIIVPAVRRLTPLECERLQGFPDNYTLIPGASDTARYQIIGNSMAVPVMHWIGKRIDIVDKYFQNGTI
jgi:DNA (cytosine-5)-methyltransferase 1